MVGEDSSDGGVGAGAGAVVAAVAAAGTTRPGKWFDPGSGLVGGHRLDKLETKIDLLQLFEMA